MVFSWEGACFELLVFLFLGQLAAVNKRTIHSDWFDAGSVERTEKKPPLNVLVKQCDKEELFRALR